MSVIVNLEENDGISFLVLSTDERFRMVRVGRADKMHARARDISSQTLAQRDARPRADARPAPPAVHEEVTPAAHSPAPPHTPPVASSHAAFLDNMLL